VKPDERGFEDAITASLVEAGGYRVCKWGTKPEWAADYDRARGLDLAELFAFIAETQPKAWERLVAVHGGADGARTQFAERLAKQLDERGTVDVLRHGINDHGTEVRLAFFKPAHGLTPELTERYLANRLTVTRQLPYNAAAAKTIDLCLFVNGIPVATRERDPGPPGARPFRGRPRARRDDNEARRARDPLPPVQPRQCGREGQRTGRHRPPDAVPVG
jgi:type I restriction enzyme R subunit